MAQSDFTIADVLAWARTKPADGRYAYPLPGSCALCEFLLETNRAKEPRVIETNWRDGMHSGERFPLPADLDGQALKVTPWTYGALVSRLETLAPKAIVLKSDWASLDAYLTDIELVSA